MTWAVVEIMGHRTRAGLISDITIGGATMLRIEHPTRAGHTGEDPLEEFYAPTAIFSIRPCSQDEAISVAAWAWAAPPALVAQPLPHELEAMVDVMVDDDEAERAEAERAEQDDEDDLDIGVPW